MADVQDAPTAWGTMAASDHAWVLSRTVAILGMQGGFALLEAGSVRPANRANIMMKNICDMTVGLAAWGCIGYTLAFGNSTNAFIGSLDHVFLLDSEHLYAHFLMQFSFAATTGTIVSGACAERIVFGSYIVLSTCLASLVYPFICHWAWTEHGWLNQLGFYDFAGAGVVHLTGGTASVILTSVLGVRTGRFGEVPRWRISLPWKLRQKAAQLLRPFLRGKLGRVLAKRWGLDDDAKQHVTRNLRRQRIARAAYAARFQLSDSVSIIYGTFILTIGWLSFNMSSGLGLSGGRHLHIGRVAVCTLFSAAFGGIAGMLFSAGSKKGMTTIEDASVGVLAGLVSVTAVCSNVHPWEAGAIGFIGGLLACRTSGLLEWAIIDDPVGAIPVHFVGGLWGIIAVGLFSRGPEFAGGLGAHVGLFHGGGGTLLGVQLLGALAIIAWTAVASLVLMLLVGMTLGLRVSPEDEELGLDRSEHGVGGGKTRPSGPYLIKGAPSSPSISAQLKSSSRSMSRLSSWSSSKLRLPSASTRHMSKGEWRREEYIVDVAHLGLAAFSAQKAAIKMQRQWRAHHTLGIVPTKPADAHAAAAAHGAMPTLTRAASASALSFE